MLQVNYVDFKGQTHTLEVAEGENVMRGALYAGLEGIGGECGGACSCATCHVYVDPAWVDRVGGPGQDERELLEQTASPADATSRLSCQIAMTAELDGLVVHMPEHQI